MAYDPISDGEGLTAAYTLANWTDQVISQVTSGTRPTGTEGQFIYETDTNKLLGHNATTFVDFGRLSGIDTWTPTVAQGASSNIAKTVNTAMYLRLGNIVIGWFNLSMTGAGTAGSAVTVSLPVAGSGHASADPLGPGDLNDASVQRYEGTWCYLTDTVLLRTTNAGNWGASPNVALASGDTLGGQFIYRVA